MGMRNLILAAAMLPGVAQAQANLSCVGVRPVWQLEVSGDTASLWFPDESIMDVMNDVPAEQRDWPRAMTLVGFEDTAILLVDKEMCLVNETEFGIEAHVLTQRGFDPILLKGCCRSSE